MKRKWILILFIICFFLPCFRGCSTTYTPIKVLTEVNVLKDPVLILIIGSIFIVPVYLFIAAFFKNNNKIHLILSILLFLINYIFFLIPLIKKFDKVAFIISILYTFFAFIFFWFRKKIFKKLSYYNVCEIVYLFIAIIWMLMLAKALYYGGFITSFGLILYLYLFLKENKIILMKKLKIKARK